jgi:type VI protein secretion system component Hcp
MESLKFVNETKRVALETQMISQELMHKTGMRTGRTIASFNYRIPVELSSSQLYTLALSYLVTNEDEKAAQILTSLMSFHFGTLGHLCFNTC